MAFAAMLRLMPTKPDCSSKVSLLKPHLLENVKPLLEAWSVLGFRGEGVISGFRVLGFLRILMGSGCECEEFRTYSSRLLGHST